MRNPGNTQVMMIDQPFAGIDSLKLVNPKNGKRLTFIHTHQSYWDLVGDPWGLGNWQTPTSGYPFADWAPDPASSTYDPTGTLAQLDDLKSQITAQYEEWADPMGFDPIFPQPDATTSPKPTPPRPEVEHSEKPKSTRQFLTMAFHWTSFLMLYISGIAAMWALFNLVIR